MAEIGVIIPVYNVEEYIEKCIDSVLRQTFQDFELILIDDGSIDKSGDICDAYACIDSRVTVIHKENGGPSAARNCGLDKNENEYIVFIDADDYVDRCYLDVLHNCIKRSGADIGICCETDVTSSVAGAYKFDYQKIVSNTEIITKAEAYRRMLLPGNVSVCAWAKIYHRRLFQSIRYPVGEIYEDCRIIDRIIEESKRIVYIPYEGYFYLIRQGSITHSKITVEHMAAADNARRLLHFIQKKYPEIEEVARGYYWRESMQLFRFMLRNPEYEKQCCYLRATILKEKKGLLRNSYIDFEQKCSIFCLCLGIHFYTIIGKTYYKIKDVILKNRKIN